MEGQSCNGSTGCGFSALVGVILFFVLSGFLITGILYDSLPDQHYFKNFYIRRSLRIFPIFYLVLAACLVLTPILHLRLQWGHISFLFYLGNFFANWNWSLYDLISPTHPALSISLAHFWSLFVEEQFYLIWPVVIFLVRDRIKLIRLSVAVILLVLLLRIGMVCFLPLDTVGPFARLLPTQADDLLMGGAMALLLRGPEAERWLRRSWLFFLSGIIAFFLMAAWRGNFGFNDPYNLSIGLTMISLGVSGPDCPGHSGGLRGFPFTFASSLAHRRQVQLWLLHLPRSLHRCAHCLRGVVHSVLSFHGDRRPGVCVDLVSDDLGCGRAKLRAVREAIPCDEIALSISAPGGQVSRRCQ